MSERKIAFDSCGKNLAFKFALLQTLTQYCQSTQGYGSKMETLPHRLRCENMNAYLWTAWIGVSHNSCRKEKLPSTHVEKILPSNLHSCKHSHNIVSPPRATDQKWRPFHTDSSAKTWMLTFEPHDLALSTTHVGKNLPFDSCGKNLAFKFALLQTLTHYCLSTQGSGSKMETLPHRLRCENMNAYLWTAWIGVVGQVFCLGLP